MVNSDVLLRTATIYEDQALSLGLLGIAIKINWIKNSIRYDSNVSYDDMFERLLQIAIFNK